MGLGFCVGILPHYTEHSDYDHRLRDEVTLLLEKLGEPGYRDDPALQRDAHARIRSTDHCGSMMFAHASRAFERVHGRHPLVGDAGVLLPRRVPGLMQGGVARYGALETAWEEWLQLGRLLGILGPDDVDVADEVATKLAEELPLNDDEEQDSDLTDARTAWFVFFEGLRVARLHGQALRVM